MGSAGVARVDTAAVRAMAHDYDTAAAIVDGALRNHLGEMRFGGVTAGRAYVAQGVELAAALDGLTAALRQWSRAAAEIAMTLRGSAQRYQDIDLRTADRLA